MRESNAFWEHWADPPFPDPVRDASSLDENVRSVDLVVRGRIIDLYIGEYWQRSEYLPKVPLVYAKIAVTEVFKGSPVSRTVGYVEIQLGSLDQAEVSRLSTALPQHDNVWFLIYTPNIRPRSSANQSDIAPYAYILTNDQQGVFRNIDGQVRVVEPAYTEQALGPHHFPLDLEGSSFDRLVEDVRQVAGSIPGQTR